MGVVEETAARLRTQVPSRTVYEHAIPDGTLPTTYLLVTSSVGRESSERLCDTTHVIGHTVRVQSVARNPNPHVAARTANAGSTFARAALRDWRPGGRQWKLRYETSAEAFRDESIPETTFVAPVQYSLRDSP